MKKLRIFFDIDGVLADTQTEVLNRYNEEYGLDYSLEDITCWDLTKVQKPGTDMTKYFNEPGFFASLKPLKGARSVVNGLSMMGDELFVASASPIEGFVDKVLWVKENFPQIPLDNVSLITRKDILCGDIILDDGLHNLSPTNFEYPIVFDQPWNRSGGQDFVRAYDWYHFFLLVAKIRKGYTYSQLLEENEQAAVC
jgi:5'-nucleotidase